MNTYPLAQTQCHRIRNSMVFLSYFDDCLLLRNKIIFHLIQINQFHTDINKFCVSSPTDYCVSYRMTYYAAFAMNAELAGMSKRVPQHQQELCYNNIDGWWQIEAVKSFTFM